MTKRNKRSRLYKNSPKTPKVTLSTKTKQVKETFLIQGQNLMSLYRQMADKEKELIALQDLVDLYHKRMEQGEPQSYVHYYTKDSVHVKSESLYWFMKAYTNAVEKIAETQKELAILKNRISTLTDKIGTKQ